MNAQGTTRLILADALQVLGAQTGKSEPIRGAVGDYREVLKELTCDRMPLYWAGIQNNLGVALKILGERGSGTAFLKEAVGTFREALKEGILDRMPLDWATTQNNLGTALTRVVPVYFPSCIPV